MTNNKKWKDDWILDAIRSGYLMPQKDGTIYRRNHASRDGRELSKSAHLVKQCEHKATGRIYFNLTWKGITKSVLVNRVIALAFLPNPDGLEQVNHIDGNKAHNALSNLEWSSGRDNEKHAHRTGLKTGRGSANSNAKLTAADVEAIRASQASPVELAKQYGVARSTITNIINRRTWLHV